VDAIASYRFSPRTVLALHQNFSKASTAFQVLTSQGTAANGLVLQGEQNGRQEVQVNNAGATLTHSFTPTWQGQLDFDYTRFDYPQNNELSVAQSSSESFVGSGQITNEITPRLTLGFGSSATRQDFQATGGQSGRGTTIYNGYGIVSYKLTPTLTFSASAGPAIEDPDKLNVQSELVRAPAFPLDSSGRPVDPNTCPSQGGNRVFDPFNPNSCQPFRFPSGVAYFVTGTTFVPFLGAPDKVQPSLTYYGHATIEKKWETVAANLTYSRTASTASGLAASTNLDSISAGVTWTPTEAWFVTTSAGYNRQTSASKSQQPLLVVVPGSVFTNIGFVSGVAQTSGVTSKLVNNAFEWNSYSAQLNVGRRLSKRLTLTTTLNWWQQKNNGEFQTQQQKLQDLRITFGFTYTFTPIPLWTKDL
jgi:hypothetical protein